MRVGHALLMCRYWMMALTQMSSPKAMISHQSQLLLGFSSPPLVSSVECFMIRVHLVRESPNPDRAPYLKRIDVLLNNFSDNCVSFDKMFDQNFENFQS